NSKSVFLKVTQREVYDFAIVSIAVVAQVEGGVWKDGRVVLSGVAPSPGTASEEALKGQAINAAVAETAADNTLVKARPMSNNAYKVDIARNLIQRAILGLTA